jgi:CBS domain-containing protein
MLIDILKSKGHEIIAQPASSTVKAVVALMSHKRIGAIALTGPDGKIIGLFTDRIVVERLAQYGSAFLEQTAADHMIAPAPTCDVSQSVSRTMRRMTAERTRHLVVKNGDQVLGLVSIGDVVKARMRDSTLEALVLRDIAQARLLADG